MAVGHQTLVGEEEAEDAMNSLNPDASDEAVACAVADLYLARTAHLGFITLSIFHDVRLRSRAGPCPLPYDWNRKNIVGVTTRDRVRARRWIISAMLAGYGVFYHMSRNSSGFGQGSIEAIRRRQL
jgi:hypothetical protein